MVADALPAAGSSGTQAFASAFIDPVFSFGPGVGSEYSFLLSEGVGNAVPIPEPNASALLLAGVLAVGFFRVARRRHG
jgi:hypothetical protein